MKCVKNNTVTTVSSQKRTMGWNVFSIWNVGICEREDLIRGQWGYGDTIWRVFSGIFPEVLEAYDTGFSIMFNFTSILTVYISSIQFYHMYYC